MRFRKVPSQNGGSHEEDTGTSLPLPPDEMRSLVGGLGPEHFDNPSGALVYAHLPEQAYEAVFDFGCGCGRLARRLIQQRPQPGRYVGIDLHAGMIRWCQTNLSPHAPGFEFVHHDVFNAGLNPRSASRTLPFPAVDSSFSLVEAWSVFTHLTESQAEHYLAEVARILTADGVFQSTWFLFDKTDFPMMQEFQNALFINDTDPTNAVIFDRGWLRRVTSSMGLVIFSIEPPEVRGFQWRLLMARRETGLIEADFPPDDRPKGVRNPPGLPPGAERIGLNR